MTPRTLSEIARLCGASLEGDGSRAITSLAALPEAGPDQVSFLAHPRYRPELEKTRAAGVLVARDVRTSRTDLALLRCSDPNRAWTEVVRAFAPVAPPPVPGVDARAVVDPSAEIDASASVAAHCSIGARAHIGARTRLHPGVVVDAGASVGEDGELHPGVVLYAGVRLGARCVIHAGAVIGADGFGFEPTESGWVKIPQCGTVVIEDDVEIGANTTIDRGRFGATRVGAGAKIDNLVHIGHNVVVGSRAMIIAQTGIAGSSKVGAGAILAGQVGVNGHVEIGERARIGGQSGIWANVPAGADYVGNPARPRMRFLRATAAAARADELWERVRELEERVRRLTDGEGKA